MMKFMMKNNYGCNIIRGFSL